MFRPICPPAFFRCLSNLETFTELRTTSFIEFTGVACSDSVSHNRVQVLSISVLLLASSQDWTCDLQVIISLEALGMFITCFFFSDFIFAQGSLDFWANMSLALI